MAETPIRVTVWGENLHDRQHEAVRAVYPDGMHTTIAAGIRENLGDRATVRTATLDQPEHGLTEDILQNTDVLTWWGHVAHDEVSDEVVDRVHARVLDGMGLVVLHSGHFSRIFRRLMGTTCDLKWREDGLRERLWVVDPSHPIADGLGESMVLAEEEIARLAVALCDPRVRDVALGFAAGHDEAVDPDHAARLWTLLARAVPAPEVAEPATVHA